MAERRLPPGPGSWNVLSTATGAARYLPGFLQRVAREHGDVASISVGPYHALLLSSPELAQDLLETNDHRFEKGRGEQRFGRRLLEEDCAVAAIEAKANAAARGRMSSCLVFMDSPGVVRPAQSIPIS